MILNKKIEDYLPIRNFDDLYVLADFDNTITDDKSLTSWKIVASSDETPEAYKTDSEKYFAKYRPIEIDEKMDFEERCALIQEWFKKHIELFVKYRITEKVFESSAKNIELMKFRKGAKEFLELMWQKNVPVIIISAGIGNCIEHSLKSNGCLCDNIFISSNKIIFKDGVATGVGENIIHSLNKNGVSLPDSIKDKIKSRKKILLLGDQISDIKMAEGVQHDVVFKTCFLNVETEKMKEEYSKEFDILVEKDEDYFDLMNNIFKEEEVK